MIIYKITMLGHKDHGKSTMLGSLLMATGAVTDERVREARRISKELGRNFEPGFILDAFSEEREGGLTIDTTRAELKYKGAGFEFIDVPGHEELIKNMLTGASNATAALLAVSAAEGEGITSQTKRHLFIAKMLGISKIAVAVNKMDVANYSRERFERIASELSAYLKRIGYGDGDFGFVPVSAYLNENLVSRSKKMKWYDGPVLMDLIMRAASAPKRSKRGARILMLGRIDNMATGKVISGVFSEGDILSFFPGGKKAAMPKMIVGGRKKSKAKAGESIAAPIRIRSIEGKIGCINGDAPIVSRTFKAKIFASARIPKNARIVINGLSMAAKIGKIKVIDTATGEESMRKLKPLDAAAAEITLEKDAAFERFSDFEELGRFTIYSGNDFAGFGIVE